MIQRRRSGSDAQPRQVLGAARALLWLWILLVGAVPGAPSLAGGAPVSSQAAAEAGAQGIERALAERQHSIASPGCEDLDGDGPDAAAHARAAAPAAAAGQPAFPHRPALALPTGAFPHFRARAPPLS